LATAGASFRHVCREEINQAYCNMCYLMKFGAPSVVNRIKDGTKLEQRLGTAVLAQDRGQVEGCQVVLVADVNRRTHREERFNGANVACHDGLVQGRLPVSRAVIHKGATSLDEQDDDLGHVVQRSKCQWRLTVFRDKVGVHALFQHVLDLVKRCFFFVCVFCCFVIFCLRKKWGRAERRTLLCKDVHKQLLVLFRVVLGHVLVRLALDLALLGLEFECNVVGKVVVKDPALYWLAGNASKQDAPKKKRKNST